MNKVREMVKDEIDVDMAVIYGRFARKMICDGRHSDAGAAYKLASDDYMQRGMHLSALSYQYLADKYGSGEPEMESPLQKALMSEYSANYNDLVGNVNAAFRNYVDAGTAFEEAGREDDARSMFAYAEFLMDLI